ncbi:lysosomal cholesterol signaling protein isoform X2 [Sardina pilchardus]|uniref:lysosomal cholesterol signaling protein isoform X2 n=1 Tax=Sardina pilchardus TaxID=27697 RepID=UPI002E0E3B94
MTDRYIAMHGLNISHSPVSASPTMSIDKLFPALLECFGIIMCGYVAGRTDIISPNQAKGLGNFVSRFALPALLFKNMVLLDFGDVIWSFLWSVLIAKVTVFVIVCSLTLMVAGPESRYSKAGLYSIFATQSNDFALGYPIVDALYRSTYPEYLQYIYLVAPVSLMLLNPIGFALCEIQRWKQSPDHNSQSKLHIISVVLLQVLKNPIVFMVLVGIVSHFLLGGQVPELLLEFVDGLANSFGGAALFYLGLSMVGQLRRLTRSTGVALILLITAKLLVMPLICKDMVEILDTANSSSANHSSLSNFAFLYGVFPTAPSVAIYAAQYNTELEVVTSGMVISTFLSAPIMYVAAWLLTIPWMDAMPLVTELLNVSFNISIISLLVLVWTISVLFLSKKFKRLPHMFVMNLFLAQLLVCVSMIIWKFVVHRDDLLGQVLIFTLLYGCLYSTYLWTGLIAFSLALMKKNEKMKIRPAVFVLLGWGIPFLTVGGLLIAGERMDDTIDSAFFYGRAQMGSTAVVLFCSIALGGLSLLGLGRGTQEEQHYHALDQSSMSGTTEDVRPYRDQEDHAATQPATPQDTSNREQPSERPVPQPMPDMIVGHLNDTAPAQTDQTGAPLREAPSARLAQEERQVARHALLCLLLIVGLLANLSSCLWWLFNKDPGRLYLELQFFCAVANYGQGFISFGIFGLDEHLIILPFKKRLASLWGSEPVEETLAAGQEDIRLTCTQFVRYHKDQCVQDLVRQRRCKGHWSGCPEAGSFMGRELVDWLVRAGVAGDRASAVLCCARLQQGGVLRRVGHQFGFHDNSLCYHFTIPEAFRHHDANRMLPCVM